MMKGRTKAWGKKKRIPDLESNLKQEMSQFEKAKTRKEVREEGRMNYVF